MAARSACDLAIKQPFTMSGNLRKKIWIDTLTGRFLKRKIFIFIIVVKAQHIWYHLHMVLGSAPVVDIVSRGQVLAIPRGTQQGALDYTV